MWLPIVLGVAFVISLVWAAVATTYAEWYKDDATFFKEEFFCRSGVLNDLRKENAQWQQRALVAETKLRAFCCLTEELED